MSLLETLAFILSNYVRKETDRYEIFLEERRNPRILAPRIFKVNIKIYKFFQSVCFKFLRKISEFIGKIKIQ
jgi:hypothetical protein